MKMNDLELVYDFRQDQVKIDQLQKATIETEEFGIVPEHGLIGTSEWWEAIEAGQITTDYIDGVISYLSENMSDWPVFEIDDGNEKSQWTCVATNKDLWNLYQVEKKARVRYAIQKAKSDYLGIGPEFKFVLEIWIEK